MPRKLLSSDGQLFELSNGAARQSITLQCSEYVGDGAVPVPLLESGQLQRITALLEQTAAVVEGMADERRDALLKDGLPRGDIGTQLRAATAATLQGVNEVADFATRLRDLKWFDSPLPMTILSEGVAQLLSGKSADVLRMLLVAHDDLGDQEKEAALKEASFTPPETQTIIVARPSPLAHSVSLAMDEGADGEGNAMACLKRCDTQTLLQLKAVSVSWQQRARRTLFGRLCSSQGPRPQRLDDVEEIDVEELQYVGRHEAVAAVRQMPNLARLRGYGFTVDLQALRQAALRGADSGPDGEEDAGSDGEEDAGSEDEEDTDSENKRAVPARGTTLRIHHGADLRSCISPSGEPPYKLLLVAMACAGSGVVLNIPVQRLRDDASLVVLELKSKNIGIGEERAQLLAHLLSGNTTVTTLGLGCACSVAPPPRTHPAVLPRPCTCGCGHVARRLSTHRTRTHAPMAACATCAADNCIGAAWVTTLAAALKENATLTTLDLRGACCGAPSHPEALPRPCTCR